MPAAPRVSRFFGREDELAAVEASILGGARLVTVTGVGGIGKTRFVAELSLRLERGSRAHRDVYGCELGQARDATDVAHVVAVALGAPCSPERDPVAHVARALGGRRAPLVILDEMDALVPFAEATLGTWMARSDVAFVVTSRVRLGLQGEFVQELGPLGLPRDADLPGATGATDAALEMLLDRARAAGAGQAVARADPAILLDIVRRLEGVPLAIELAAGRLRVLGVAELAERLARPLDVLRGGHGRHATLTASIDASWELLSEAERAALAQASVFAGGFDVTAAESVLDAGGAALDVVHALVDKSMISRRSADESSRLVLLESLRTYAAARLAEMGWAADVRVRHARHYAALAAASVDELDAARDPGAARRLRAGLIVELHNLQAALEVAATAEPAAWASAALDIALAFHVAYRALGRRGAESPALATAIDVARRAARANGAVTAPRVSRKLAVALLSRADCLRLSGDDRGALEACEEALEIARGLADVELEAVALATRGDARGNGDALAAEDDLDAAVRALHAWAPASPVASTRRSRALARTHVRLARHHHRAARPAASIEHALAAAQAAATIHDEREEAEALLFLAAASNEAGHHEAVERACRRAHALSRDTPEGSVPAFADYALGVQHQERGQFDEAEDCFARSAARDRRLGNVRQEATTRLHLARLALERGRLDDAERGLVAVLAPLAEVGHRRALAVALTALAGTRARLGAVQAAEHALDEAKATLGDDVVNACAAAAAALVDLARAASAPEREAARLRLEAERRLAPPDRRAAAAARDLEARSEDVRTMWRIARCARAPAAEDRPPLTLAIDPKYRWFRVGDAPPVDLARKRTAARLLEALVVRRREAPGAPLGLEELFRSGWPGQRVRSDAAANRVYVAVSSLRKLGLRGHVVSGVDGWMLDPRVELV